MVTSRVLPCTTTSHESPARLPLERPPERRGRGDDSTRPPAKRVPPPRLLLSEGRVKGALVTDRDGKSRPVSAGEFVVAVPHGALHRVTTDDVRDAAPSLGSLHKLRSEWMNGIQFYLKRDIPIVDGHCIFVDSPWALTAISQRQFWTGVDLSDYRDGQTRGILSVDISDWNTPGVLFGRPARQCSSQEIGREVWAQIKMHLNGQGRQELADADVLRCVLDASIMFESPKRPSNKEPLFINTVGSWKCRPEVQTEIENLCVAGDFVRTHTDLATMEAANESGRRAAASILERAGAHYSVPQVWRLPEPEGLAPLKVLDARRFERGEPHEWYDGKANSLGDVFAHRLSQLRGQRARVVRLPASTRSEFTPAASVEVGRRQSANRTDTLFTNNPTQASTVIGKERTRVPLPFHAYEADSLVLYGTACATAMRTILHGTALHPVVGGADFGYAMLWIIRYSDTSCGPYSEVVVNFVACGRPRAFEFRNDYSIVAAMLDTDNVLFTPQLLLDRQLPIDYGREIYGLDKRPAEIEIDKSGPVKRFVCRGATGEVIVAGSVQEENRPAEQALALLDLRRNIGLRRITGDLWRILRGEPSTGVLVTRDVRREDAILVSEIVGTYKFAPSFARWSPRDALLVHESAPFGRL
ncbi:MAG: acetoacetate decarboxylase family protein, partial [Myxococcales bacterium]|nr:acetoacetate decarboxylase family protein [Myxococcales bacterium]